MRRAWMVAAAITIAATAQAGLAVTTPPTVEAAGCATKAEYRRVRIDATMTPARVQRIFGARGRITATAQTRTAAGQTVYVTAVRFPRCKKHHSVAVYFRGSADRPAVAVAKVWQ